MSELKYPLTHPKSAEDALKIESQDIANVLKKLIYAVDTHYDKVVCESKTIQVASEDAKKILDLYGHKLEVTNNGQ